MIFTILNREKVLYIQLSFIFEVYYIIPSAYGGFYDVRKLAHKSSACSRTPPLIRRFTPSHAACSYPTFCFPNISQ